MPSRLAISLTTSLIILPHTLSKLVEGVLAHLELVTAIVVLGEEFILQYCTLNTFL